ncbi:hypothetical protein DENSPDRAFT_823787 [Dentipellis sp. KUC8613]|nr:hypothetical protein DENSPDRAFT_823787 [Dentipellis sp. KUC8613]
MTPPRMNVSAVSSSRTLAAQGKRARPPTLSLATSPRRPSNTILELETPVDDPAPNRFPPASPISPVYATPLSPTQDADYVSSADDLSKDLAVLEQLRLSVQKNLRLRPIRHSPTPPHSPVRPLSSASSTAWSDYSQARSSSPSSSIASPSIYYTPISEARSPPLSAHYIGNGSVDPPPIDSPSPARALHPVELATQLALAPDAPRPLLLDTRPVGLYLASRIKYSINLAIPTLILKRSRKPGNGFQSIDGLRQFITTEQSKDAWDELMRPGGGWDGNVIVFDEEMNEKERHNVQATAWALLPVVAPLLTRGFADYLEGGVIGARMDPDLRAYVVSGEQEHEEHNIRNHNAQVMQDLPPPPAVKLSMPPKKGIGLFQLDTVSASKSKALPELEHSAGISPLPMMPSAISSWNITDATPSPPPSSQSVFPRPPPPRRPSLSALRRLDTKSAERLNLSNGLPKLQVRTVPMPMKSATLAAPPMNGVWPSSPRAHSPSHLTLVHSNHTPPGSAMRPSFSPTSSSAPSEWLLPPSPSRGPMSSPRTPTTPMPLPRTPHTARPDDQPPTTEEPFPEFSVSTILPNFLFLGPELTTEEHVQELERLGVKRILNIAAECDDDHGLRLRERFDRYIRIPMRDTVEEENIARGVREVCEILDDASLHSAATYVHCKAGKSRSVTAVMAYLIHANHWTLSRAYGFVLERRKGISPNIGFVSELMNFEEQELGGKSIGVVKQPTSAGGAGHDGDDGEHELPHAAGGGRQGNYAAAVVGARRTGHMRESLPPAFSISSDAVFRGGPDVGDVGQEMEIRDAEGRYRHVRRAPVDATTLQPMRRVSKAGLESAWIG